MPSPNVKPTAIRFWPDLKAPIQAIADEHGFTFHAVVLHLVKVGLGAKVDWSKSGLRIVGTKIARAEKVKAEKPAKAPKAEKVKRAPKAEAAAMVAAPVPAKPKTSSSPTAKTQPVDTRRYDEWLRSK